MYENQNTFSVIFDDKEYGEVHYPHDCSFSINIRSEFRSGIEGIYIWSQLYLDDLTLEPKLRDVVQKLIFKHIATTKPLARL